MAAADIAILDVRLHSESIGTLTRLPGDRVLLAFNDAYAAKADRPTLSLSFRDRFGALIVNQPPTQTRLPPFFANLLPEGAFREYLAARAGVNPAREFFLLGVLGRDLPGALEIVPLEGAPWRVPDDEAKYPAAIAADDTPLRFSLAGVQLKFSAMQEAAGGLTIPTRGVGGDWIVKLPSSTFPAVPENEFAMMSLARRIGIDVPEIRLVPIDQIRNLPAGIEAIGKTAFATRRFDRLAGGGSVHIEDFAQVFDVYPERKYERASYRSIAEVLWAETGEAGTTEFLRRLVFNILIGNGDMHLKNWSLLYPERRAAIIAPAYDFVSMVAYLPRERLALGLGGTKEFHEVTLESFETFVVKAGLPRQASLDAVMDTIDAVRAAWRDSGDLLMASNVRTSIDSHLERLPLWAK